MLSAQIMSRCSVRRRRPRARQRRMSEARASRWARSRRSDGVRSSRASTEARRRAASDPSSGGATVRRGPSDRPCGREIHALRSGACCADDTTASSVPPSSEPGNLAGTRGWVKREGASVRQGSAAGKGREGTRNHERTKGARDARRCCLGRAWANRETVKGAEAREGPVGVPASPRHAAIEENCCELRSRPARRGLREDQGTSARNPSGCAERNQPGTFSAVSFPFAVSRFCNRPVAPPRLDSSPTPLRPFVFSCALSCSLHRNLHRTNEFARPHISDHPTHRPSDHFSPIDFSTTRP